MSIGSEIERLGNAKDDIADAIEAMGVEVPAGTKLDGLATLIQGGVNGHIQNKNNPHEVTAKQIGARSIEPDYQITGAAGWYKFLVVPVESNRSRKIVLRLVESYTTVGVAIISMYLNRNSSGEWTATSANIISSVVINNTDIGYVLNEQDNEVEYYYRKRSSTSGQVLVNVLESVARTGGLVDLSEQFESTLVSEFPSDGTYFYPTQDGAGNVISTTYATKTEVNELDAEDVGAVPDTELNGTMATVSGAVASFETTSAQTLPGLVVDIDFVQEGSGDPGPTNIRPISGWNAVNVWRTGKNLLPDIEATDTTVNGITFAFADDGTITINGTATASGGVNLITQSFLFEGGYLQFHNNATTANIACVFTFRDGTVWSSSLSGSVNKIADGTSHIGKTVSNVQFYFTASFTASNITLSPMLCISSTATPYEPYSGNQYTIQLGQTVYGGTLDVTNGILTITMGSIELSDLDWSDSTSTRYISKTVPGMKPVPSGYTLPNLIAEQYRTITWHDGLTNNHDGIAVSNNDNATLLLYKSSSTPEPSGRIVYELTTPIEYTLSPIQVFALLGQNNLWADTGNISVTYRTGKVALLSDVADAVEISKALIDSKTAEDVPYQGTVGGIVVTNVKEALDHLPTGSNATPNMDANPASSGISDNWSRSDHRHPSDTSRVPITRKINNTPLNSDLVLYWPGEITLSLSWSGSGPWTQSDPEILIPLWSGGITSNSSVTLRPTAAQISQLITDGVTALTVENNNGILIVYAFGATPSTAMTIACTVMEVSS